MLRPLRHLRLATLLLLVAAALAPCAGAGAQQSPAPPFGSIAGVVFDSILGRPLPGAEVWLESNPRSALTDSTGAFRIDSLPAGTYAVTFGHASLDSLRFGAPVVRIAVVAGRVADVRLAVPSVATIAALVCPTVRLDTAGVLLGAVRDASSGTPIAGARVTARWVDWVVGARVARQERELTAETDAAGGYRLCGVPNDVVADLRATAPARLGVTDLGTGQALLDLNGRALTVNNIAVAVRSAATEVAGPGAATLMLAVVGPDDRPVAGAQARTADQSAFAAAGDDGRVRLAGLAPGSRTVELRAIGFEPATVSVDLAAGEASERRVGLARSRATTLETVRITGARNGVWDRTGFEERRRSGFGTFIGASDVERRQAQRLTQLLVTVPGLSVRPGPGSSNIVTSNRSTRGRVGRPCPIRFVVDGVPLADDENSPLDIDTVVNPKDIRGVEIYAGLASAPARYGPTGCGMILVWTK